jgi:hypothetical protein
MDLNSLEIDLMAAFSDIHTAERAFSFCEEDPESTDSKMDPKTLKMALNISFDGIHAPERLLYLFEEWTRIQDDPNMPKYFSFLLDRLYTSSSLSFNTLSGSDNRMVELLLPFCGRFGFAMYLADLVISVYGECDHGRGLGQDFHQVQEELMRMAFLTKVVGYDGSTLATKIIFDENSVQCDPFQYEEHDDKDCSEHTGDVTCRLHTYLAIP